MKFFHSSLVLCLRIGFFALGLIMKSSISTLWLRSSSSQPTTRTNYKGMIFSLIQLATYDGVVPSIRECLTLLSAIKAAPAHVKHEYNYRRAIASRVIV